jgi:hypothetical protein
MFEAATKTFCNVLSVSFIHTRIIPLVNHSMINVWGGSKIYIKERLSVSQYNILQQIIKNVEHKKPTMLGHEHKGEST